MLAHAGLTEEAEWVRHHHERLDGGGYPDGLTGEEIPLEARIIFVADAFEAMTSDRPYRSGIPVEEALAELQRGTGTQFDPEIVDLLGRLVASGDLPVMSLRRRPDAGAEVPSPSAKLPRPMAVLWALIVGLVAWIVLWAIGVKAFDAFLITLVLVVSAAAWRVLKPFLDQQLGRT